MAGGVVVEVEDSTVDTLVVVIGGGTPEYSAADIPAVYTALLPWPDTMAAIEAGITVGIVEGTMAVIGGDTIEGSMVEAVSTIHIGDYGDGVFGDGLF